MADDQMSTLTLGKTQIWLYNSQHSAFSLEVPTIDLFRDLQLRLGEHMKTRRVTANLRPEDMARLAFISACTGLNKNDSVRKALATQVWVDRTLAEGRKILTEDGKGNIREVVFR